MAGMNMVFMYGLSLIGYFFFALVFAVLYKGIPGKGVKKGLMYGLLLWLVTAFLGMSTMPFYMNIAPVLVIYWIAQALIMDLVGGAILGAIYKK